MVSNPNKNLSQSNYLEAYNYNKLGKTLKRTHTFCILNVYARMYGNCLESHRVRPAFVRAVYGALHS